MVDGVRIGSIQMGHHDFSSLDRIEKDVAVFNAPFVFRDPDHAMKATSEATFAGHEGDQRASSSNKGSMRIVANFYRGARQLTARYAVHSPKDMQGKKFRAVPTPLWNSMIKGMGAVPTPVEISEIMPALMTGLVEGQENPLNNVIARKMWEANKFVMMTSHMESVLAVFVNEKSWTSIPEADRKLMQEAFDEMGKRSLQWAKDAEAGEIEILEEERRHHHRREERPRPESLPRGRHQADPDRLSELEGLFRQARRGEVAGSANAPERTIALRPRSFTGGAFLEPRLANDRARAGDGRGARAVFARGPAGYAGLHA